VPDNDVALVGERVETILAGLRSTADPRTAAVAEELVGLVVQLYGAGFAQVVAILKEIGPEGSTVMDRLIADPLLESLLLLHGLHPMDVDTRIQQALDRVRPYLGSHAGGVEYLGVDSDGVARLRLEGSCHGCPSSTVTVSLAIETAVREAAPEVEQVVVEGMADRAPTLLQIGRPPSERSGGPEWVELGPVETSSQAVVATLARSERVAVCDVSGMLYAYRDSCAACGSSLVGGRLDGTQLSCPRCHARFDVHLAGRGVDQPGQHLDPLPLLVDQTGVRVALSAELVAR
jgi:Fe-S cluster biogenesis protein NfuA/nitrite reductase/ring-hydroxylating ferredoxin subunit